MPAKSKKILLIIAILALIIPGFFIVKNIRSAESGFGAGDYTLIDQNGKPFTYDRLKGHPSLVFFGFTHCPDVCPTTISEISVIYKKLGDEAKDLRAYFVTVDPERDTPEKLKEYVSWISPNVLGISGSRKEIDKMIAAFHVHSEKSPTSDGGYTMNHTASVFLLDDNTDFVGTISYGEDADTALAKVKKLINQSG